MPPAGDDNPAREGDKDQARRGSAPVAVLSPGPGAPEASAASALAERLGLPLRPASELTENELVLARSDEALELWAGAGPRQGRARVEWGQRPGSGRSAEEALGQPLQRAIGRSLGLVVDATAGFGTDAFALACRGHRVLALERSPVMAALLEDGRARALADPELREPAARIEIRWADARQALAELDETPDAIYIDPMYPVPTRAKAALPPLKIQLLRRLVGADLDAESLLEAALATRAHRVVVKRPPAAPVWPGPLADSHTGKLVRYDVYHSAAPGRTEVI
ncbi:MAG: class I SAM-dependent methyltransferase [Myxococcota bacterium]|nr:class I SAM-dependent methyltransferase [Myxococcota bacterium]